MIAFGPVPSRRLGRSLGINNIPPKHCSYSCVYCQLGTTAGRSAEPQFFYDPRWLRDQVAAKVEAARTAGEAIDYLTFVPDGEPTLDEHLGEAIDLLRPLGIPVAVITNASLVGRPEVRDALLRADWLSLKVDAVAEPLWRRVDRPAPGLHLAPILAGIESLAKAFTGTLTTETMLVRRLNDGEEAVTAVAHFLAKVKSHIAYLAVPTRPPADHAVQPPDPQALTAAYEIFRTRLPRVEYLIGWEGDAFAATGDVVEDLLSITAVHPMREDALREFLAKGGATWEVVEDLLQQGRLRETQYQGRRFYLRAFPDATGSP